MQLFTPNGHDWTERFPLIVEALYALKATTCLMDGETVTCATDGLADFDRLRYGRGDVHLCAFDLVELDGRDLRLEPFTSRRTLQRKFALSFGALASVVQVQEPGSASGYPRDRRRLGQEEMAVRKRRAAKRIPIPSLKPKASKLYQAAHDALTLLFEERGGYPSGLSAQRLADMVNARLARIHEYEHAVVTKHVIFAILRPRKR